MLGQNTAGLRNLIAKTKIIFFQLNEEYNNIIIRRCPNTDAIGTTCSTQTFDLNL